MTRADNPPDGPHGPHQPRPAARVKLFLAVLPAPEAIADLAAALGSLHRLPGDGDLRWTEPDGWHYTLAYLGTVPDARRPDLDERLARAARRHDPLALRTAGGGRFGDRVLWAGAEGDLPALSALADSVRAAARRAGTPADEEHAFRAHLTLARTRKHAAVDLRPHAAVLAGHRGPQWSADSLSMVASNPPAPGVPGAQPHYTTVASWALGRPATEPPGDRAPEAAG